MGLDAALMERVNDGTWCCPECTVCEVCGRKWDDESELLLCDRCDRGVHMGCMSPPVLGRVPSGKHVCERCAAGTADLPAAKRLRGRPRYTLSAAEQELVADAHAALQERGGGEGGTIEVRLGRHTLQSWYRSPYPHELQAHRAVHLCERCLGYHASAAAVAAHREVCGRAAPPGEEIYRSNGLSFFEVDGTTAPVYSQNLCLLAKLFLKSKTRWFDVAPFVFYVLVAWTRHGPELVGYFSKEKATDTDFNLSCILTLPVHQRQGYGQLLIDFSYLLSRREGRAGTPEKPLSDLGLLSYRAYWRRVLLAKLRSPPDDDAGGDISIRALSLETGIDQTDIVTTLQTLGLVKYWKGKHVVVRDPALLGEPSSQRHTLDESALDWPRGGAS